ncbi:hypothetical protein [uncultured Ilumatobacter sp.]|jgi:hypothetical protein|uniref:hypothetical protein n=1 Tax=uncultured Ilumatobacter sp. TaxID=879968 RepID=UPI00374F750B|tara:strand:+ start:1782 stop:2051 length:270 start_codon:yes stop_codon:yes gene_type:complete
MTPVSRVPRGLVESNRLAQPNAQSCGVGTFAVQIAKHIDERVTLADHGAMNDLVDGGAAVRVIDGTFGLNDVVELLELQALDALPARRS